MLKTALVTGFSLGGQLMSTSEVENFPGYPDGIKGPEMMEDLRKQAERFGTKLIYTSVTDIEHTRWPFDFEISLTSTELIKSKAVIVASGAEAQWLNLEGEKKLRGKGLSTCATCDGAFFRGDELLVIGGGDSAMEESMFLTRYAKKVTIVHRRNDFRASKIMLQRARANPAIEWVTNAVVKQWQTDDHGYLNGAVLDVNGGERTISCAGAFIAIGHKPITDFLPVEVALDKDGYIILVENTQTSVAGIFACGDVTDRRYKQAITAAGQGCQAAMDVEKWLEMMEHSHMEMMESQHHSSESDIP
jgi:thioredoxin reductase (NADPH)